MQVCHLGDTDHLSYTANRDCSVVAWAECCRVAVRFMQGSERAFWLELPTRHPHTPVLAMQWAPDGRKLLLLALEGGLPLARTLLASLGAGGVLWAGRPALLLSSTV